MEAIEDELDDERTHPSRAESPDIVFAHIAASARELGFEFCSHGVRMPLPVTRPKTEFFSNFPAVWLARYRSANYLDLDPTVAHGMRSSDPLVWSDSLFARTPQLWSEAQAFGIRYGWCQSRREPEGMFSMLVLARSDEPIMPGELALKEPRMKRLVNLSHDWMRPHYQPDLTGRPAAELTAREIDVLRWTADGKTSCEIAEILEVSERTVNFHIHRIVGKLGARNKINAAVRAAMLGLMW